MFVILCLLFVNAAIVTRGAERVTPPDFAGAKQPQIAIASSGEIYVAFGKDQKIYVTRSEDAGRTFSSPTAIGELEKLALGMRRGPRIATTGKSVTVTAISHANGNLHSWFSQDSGRSWSQAMVINSTTNSAREGMHALATDGTSKLFSVWLDLRNGKTELWGSVSQDRGATWGSNVRIYQSPSGTICECCHPSAVFDSSGKIVAMWRNALAGNRDLYQSESSDSGKTFSQAQKIGTGTWPLAACPMDGGSLGVAGEKISYAWRREGILFATDNESSETVLAERGTQPVVVPRGKEFSYVWQNDGDLFWKSSTSAAPELLAQDAAFAAAAWSERDRKAFIVWETSNGIFISSR
ncbi:MAG: sialidase family protein [Limisphaerales bacterium]